MRLGSRTIVRSIFLSIPTLLGAFLSDPAAAPQPPANPLLVQSVSPQRDSAAKAPLAADSIRKEIPGDSAAKTAVADSTDSTGHTIVQDSLAKGKKKKRVPPVFGWRSTLSDVRDCRTGGESAPECWRQDPEVANQELGWPGTRGWTLSLSHWRPLPQESPYFPFWNNSPYLSGGLAPPERFALKKIGGDAVALEEAWSPVVPLDTPMTRMDWSRGALSLNVFELKLNRMLSDRIYLGMEYYSSTASAQPYDYQFNLHQPYLGGWGFLGAIYGPINRDSLSIVLEDTSYSIHALHVRPRLGVWLDTNRVVELFLDRVSNGTSLTLPFGPSRKPGALVPGGPDSAQALMPTNLSTLTEGVIYGETHRGWTGQMELSHGSMDLTEYRQAGTAATGAAATAAAAAGDEITGDVFRARGSVLAQGLPWKPYLSAEARSETWDGEPSLSPVPGLAGPGWADAQAADVELSPTLSILSLRAQAGMGRNSRMDNQVFWLPRYGASADLDLPFGFAAGVATSSRDEDPSWEILYRSNPARFRFASPDLEPRTDRTVGGTVSWSWSRLSLLAGADRLQVDNPWLPRVLPNPGACGALADSVYKTLAGSTCDDTSAVLPDSLALGLRNYGRETVDALRLGLGLGLGHWTLTLDNRFVLGRTVDDTGLKTTIEDLSIPERVFKGRLNWKRSLLDGRLKLDFGWDWEWFSTRYAWVPDLAGNSKVGKLDEYLALDMDAAMMIKTFTLYFKVRNFNHDRYATEPGVHPPGVNFRFGVDWVLFN
jgi:hypothetical protein